MDMKKGRLYKKKKELNDAYYIFLGDSGLPELGTFLCVVPINDTRLRIVSVELRKASEMKIVSEEEFRNYIDVSW